MSTCFVIQPFDGGKFDKRYADIVAPAINSAGIKPYRVDEDPNVSIPINEIESGIRNAVLCLADITLDNPNVWFELGYAISAGKPVVMICSDERTSRFPFDVQHRSIIRYTTESPRDFEKLKSKISLKVTSMLKKSESLQKLSSSSLAKIEGLSTHEIIALAAIAENLDTPEDNVSAYTIKSDVENNGFTRMAAMMGLKNLIKKNLISFDTFEDMEYNREPYTGYFLTEDGWDWILKNQDKFQIRKPSVDDENPF
jgi:hypothetical protein